MRTHRFGLLTWALAFLGNASAAPVPERILIDMTMTRDSRPAVTARLAVVPEQDAEITVTSSSQAAESYRIRALAAPAAHPQGRPGTMVRISLQVFERAGTEWVLRGEPWFVSPLHDEGVLPAGEGDLSTATFANASGSSSLEMTVFATALSEHGLGALRKQCSPPSDPAAGQARTTIIQPDRPPEGEGCADCGGGIYVCCRGAGACCGAGSCGCCT